MTSERSGRASRRVILDCINRPGLQEAIGELCRRVPTRRFLRPLFSLIRSEDQKVKHRAASALGLVTATLAETDLEAARDVVRRLMLTLTEESGGIGWGSPEAIGEILARHERLAGEYAHILVSYACQGEENYLEYEPLQRGVLWGLGRLAQARPGLLLENEVLDCLRPHFESHDPTTRALAAWTAGLVGIAEGSCPAWDRILKDAAAVQVYLDGKPVDCRVRDLADGSWLGGLSSDRQDHLVEAGDDQRPEGVNPQ